MKKRKEICIEAERNYHNIHNFLLATIVRAFGRAFGRICNVRADLQSVRAEYKHL